MWSIINRSPRTLVREIILVDDASEHEWLGQQLDDYVKELPIPCYVLRQFPRHGLMKARLVGAKQAKVNFVLNRIIYYTIVYYFCIRDKF